MNKPSPRVITVALLGAESTGKTQLAHALAEQLRETGAQAIAVDEYLREWCETKGRTPQPDEQFDIALQQRLRIEQAVRELTTNQQADQPNYVIADTTPLMTAVYSEFIFQDSRLHASAASYQRRFDITLVTGLDMPWQADGIQRDGEHVRAPVDALLRRLLQEAQIPFEVIYSQGDQRLKNALHAIQRIENAAQNRSAIKTLLTTDLIATEAEYIRAAGQNDLKKWQWNCEKCSDPECEHRLFRQLLEE